MQHWIHKCKSRNAYFIIIAPRGRFHNLRALGPSNLRTLRTFAPFGAYGTTFAPVGSMSLDFQVAVLPYKSSSFATPQAGGQKIAGNHLNP